MESKGREYLTIENNVLIKCDNEVKGVIEIPEGVTSIGRCAFFNCGSFNCPHLTGVIIPNSVISIDDMAFYNCKNLKSVIIPHSVTSIGDSAFSYCTNLTNITIPNSVTSIGHGTFAHCISLKSITLPNSVKSIGDWAFFDCISLKSITIPESVTSIGNNAFYSCTHLTSITIPNNVTSIGNIVFGWCKNLKSITMFDSIINIGYDVFLNCAELKNIVICKGDVKVPIPYYYHDGIGQTVLIEKTLLNGFIMTDIKSRQQYFENLENFNDYKIPLALFMALAYPQETYYINYLRDNAKETAIYLTNIDDIELFYRFLEFGFITSKNIDELINYAIKHTQNGGNSEFQLILSKYKKDNIDYKSTDTFDEFML